MLDVTPDARRRASGGVLRLERNLREEVARRLADSRAELHLTPERVERVVALGLELARQAPLVPACLDREPGDRRPAGPVYAVGQLTGSWARAVIDLPDPLDPERIRQITFDHAVAAGGADDVVLAHLGHPLVGQAMRLLRSRIWASGETDLSRVTARVVPDAELAEPVMAVHAWLVITGQGGHRLHEEVIAAGGRVHAGRCSREGYGVGELARVLDAATDTFSPAYIREQLAQAWPALEDGARAALTARANKRADSLARLLAGRAEDDVRAMRSVLIDLRASILAELEALEEPEQLLLFEPNEREQFTRRVDALRTRVEAIPAEIDAEEANIRARYADQATRIFPAAVTFLVPRRLAATDPTEALGARGSTGVRR